SAPEREVVLDRNAKVEMSPVTLGAVGGGGLSGERDDGFGELAGVVAQVCVPGDIVCALAEDSELARSLVQIGKNVSGNVEAMTRVENAQRMAGVMALQAVDTLTGTMGLPETKLTADSLQTLIELAAGAAMSA